MGISIVQTLNKKMKDSVETKPDSGRPTKISATTARKGVWDTKKTHKLLQLTYRRKKKWYS